MERWDPEGPIFISYRRADGQRLAELLDTLLRAGGLVPWRDLVDLPPGETAQRVNDAFAGGISSAILLVTPDIGNSSFIPETELPPLLALDADPDKGFQLLVGNTIERPGLLSSMDEGAPDRLLGVSGRELLKNRKQYALLGGRSELRQMLSDLLKARLDLLRANADSKEPGIQGDEIEIHTQTRPAPTALSRHSGHNANLDGHDLTVRLRQDQRTGVPEEIGYRCLQLALPLLVDALYEHGVKKVVITGGGHFSLAWALGAALTSERMGWGSFSAGDLGDNRWGEPKDFRANNPDDKGSFTVKAMPYKPPTPAVDGGTRGKVAVLIRSGNRVDEEPFKSLAASLPGCVGTLVITVEKPWSPSARIPAAEGHRLAREIRNILGRWGSRYDLHIASTIPVALAALVGRQCNTLNCVLYELGTDWASRAKRYHPTIRVQSGSPHGPITEVFPGRRFSWSSTSVREMVNLMPSDVHLAQAGRRIRTWPAAGCGQAICAPEDVEWLDGADEAGVRVPLATVTPGPLEGNPPMVDGVLYIVPRSIAAASSRADYCFPVGEVRDSAGEVVGVEGFGQFPANDIDLESLTQLLAAMKPRHKVARAVHASGSPNAVKRARRRRLARG